MTTKDDYRYVKDESSDSRLSDSAELDRENLLFPSHMQRRKRCPPPSWTVVTLLCLLTMVSSGWLTYIAVQSNRSSAKCVTADMELPSGVALSKVDRTYYEKMRDHWNFTSNTWTQHPSENPNVDALWTSLGVDDNNIWIRKSEGEKMGIDPTENVWFPNISKLGGEGGFPVVLEAIHQLHCLNTLRKNLWYNADWYKARNHVKAVPQIQRAHINHCLDALRQKLMCDAEIGVVTWGWVDANNWVLPNFHQARKCHNFDAVAQFNVEWEADEDLKEYLKGDFHPPEDAVVRTYRSFFSNKDWEEWGRHVPLPPHNGRKWKHVGTDDGSHADSFF